MEYKFSDIEKKWQRIWQEKNVYKTNNPATTEAFSKPKYYVLDMFPYPSGAGLHVGHPLGYIASDIYARYKKLKGFRVLHPMGYDAFGLPAEQYAIEHGIHPAISTADNIRNFRSQLDKIGFCFDWDRQVNTSEPGFYKWTQWIFLQLFKSFYNRNTKKAEPIENLLAAFEKEGNISHPIPDASFQLPATGNRQPVTFTAAEWKSFDEKTQQEILMEYRLAYCGIGEVNWCEALGTVLANDEVINGVSERGGYPVVKKKLRQWYLRITEYADRLLEGLNQVDFSMAMKEMQTNWIGKSSGAEIKFGIKAPTQPSPAGKGELHKEIKPAHYTADPSLYDITKRLSEEKRRNPTPEESIVWEKLRSNQTGHHIRQQHIIGPYIVDFVCIDKKLTIEIDGNYHFDPEQKKYDESRTAYLKDKGFKEIRFTNREVKENISTVIGTIKKELDSLPSTNYTTSPAGGGQEGALLKVYTTRPDTIFGVDFMVVAPEHPMVEAMTTPEQKQAVEKYISYAKSHSERERMAEKKITGVFSGAYALHPFNGKPIPVWISEYVLAGYGTGAIMGVPCGDQRDFLFAKYFNIPITNIIGKHFNGEEANPTWDAVLENSDFINGMVMRAAIDVVIGRLESMGTGKRKVNFKMRDAAFSRQRYWGEPFPIIWKNGIAYPLDEKELPLLLPEMEKIVPGKDGEGPLTNLKDWIELRSLGGEGSGVRRESSTMPGYAGSSWYFLRYMDPHNEKTFCDRTLSDYWDQVDLYVGGTEHAVGHLLYSRMWTKFLCDRGWISFDEPYKKLLNQGMIQGSSRFIYRITFQETVDEFVKEYSNEGRNTDLKKTVFISQSIYHQLLDLDGVDRINKLKKYLPDIPTETLSISLLSSLHIDVNIVDGVELNIEAFRKSKPEYANAILICEDGSISSHAGGDQVGAYICGTEVEKMSKSKLNTVNPDDIVAKYGADTFRMYEMFLGPVEMSKPWDTKGIEGVHRFLRKLWRLFYDDSIPNTELRSLLKGGMRRGAGGEASEAELKILHKTIKKISEDTERFSFNTAVSSFMICVNELTELKCYKKEILLPLLILLQPYAPFITEELFSFLEPSRSLEAGGKGIAGEPYPVFEEKYIVESKKTYPVAVNGKMRTEITVSLEAGQEEVEQLVLANETVKKWLEGKPPKKIIYVKNKMINVVV